MLDGHLRRLVQSRVIGLMTISTKKSIPGDVRRKSFIRIERLYDPVIGLMGFVIWLVPCFETRLRADGYTLTGIVTSVAYNLDGSPRTKERAPGVPPTITCDFIWYRSNEKWRLDIRQPDSAFPTGVWKTIMPFSESNIISVIRYPPRPDNPKSLGNTFVTVMTNKFLPAQHIYGAHAVWLTFNFDQVMTMFGPKGCPPFWDYDPAVHTLPVESHRIIPTNGSVLFYNLGYYFARDSRQNVLLEAGRPKLVPLSSPLDKGFIEAEYQRSVDLLDQGRQIPKRAELKYWTPLRDETKPNAVRMVMLSKLIVESRSLDSEPIPESTFSPQWTNAHAVVVDFRDKAVGGQALNYVTKDKQLNASEDELRKRKQFSDQMWASAPPGHPPKRLPVIFLLLTVCALPLGLLWWFSHKKGASS
jgi:hypothetical protein